MFLASKKNGPNRIQSVAVVLLLIVTMVFAAPPVCGQTPTLKIRSKGKVYVGRQLAYDGRDMVLLRRDGRISILKVANSSDIKKVANDFEPFNNSVMRRKLQNEFGGKYQISQTRNFIVVHPPGEAEVWANPFEKIYQRFRRYFTSRGLTLNEPEFPMVAVVLRTRKEFDRFLRSYHQLSPTTLGYYSQKSNRIITYDPTNGAKQSSAWAFNSTLIHEAVHQTSFNIGLHKRFASTPLWVLEGLACMFEAKGLHNSVRYSRQKDRINKNRLASLQHYFRKNQVQGKLQQFVNDDAMFESNQALAYAYSWGLTFFLAEKYPQQFMQFLKKDASRKEFRTHSADQRLRAFKDAFGTDLKSLEKRMERFITKLKA